MDQTWKKSYSVKPDWWDDETEPRCDVCGVHTEDADDWCGDCGTCMKHCECEPTYTSADMYGHSPYFDDSVTIEALDRDPYRWEL